MNVPFYSICSTFIYIQHHVDVNICGILMPIPVFYLDGTVLYYCIYDLKNNLFVHFLIFKFHIITILLICFAFHGPLPETAEKLKQRMWITQNDN